MPKKLMILSEDGQAPASRGRPRARQFGSRPVPLGVLDGSNPLYLTHNRLYTYEYSAFVTKFGGKFLCNGCDAVRSKLAGGNVKSWVANYVTSFDYLVCALVYYLEKVEPASRKVMSEEDWSLFAAWFSNQLEDRGLAGGREQTRIVFNRLFELLRVRGVVPKTMDLPSERKFSRAGESKFTVKGWNHKKKEEVVAISSFQFIAHGRLYSYDQYSGCGAPFVLDLVRNLGGTRSWKERKTALRASQVLMDFLSFLKAEKAAGRWADLFRHLGLGRHRQIESKVWQRVLYGWREKMRMQKRQGSSQLRKLTTVNLQVGRFSRLWRELADTGLVGSVLIERIPGGGASNRSTPRRSIAQVGRTDGPDFQEVKQLWKRFDTDEQEGAREYIHALAQELGAEHVAAMSAAELARAIVALNSKRLDALRGCAEREFQQWWKHWNDGQAAMAASPYGSKRIVELLDSPQRTTSERRSSATALLYSGDEQVRSGNCLKYVLATQDGIASGLIGRYHVIMLTFPSRYHFHAYLHPHKQATNALSVLLMVDSAANCEVVREMPNTCLRKSIKEGLMRVNFGGKARAGMKSIQDTFTIEPEPGQKLSCIQAIQAYEIMSARYRAMAVGKTRKYLLLHENKGEVNNPTQNSARTWFGQFCDRHPELRGLPLLPSMVRTSALMRTFHSQPGSRLEAARVQGDQASLATAHRYTGQHFPAQVLFEAQIHEFTQVWQAMVIVTIKTAAGRLGIFPQQLTHLLSEGARTGLGVACLDAYAGIQPGTTKGEHCFRQENCWDCQMRYVMGSVEHILDMMLFHEHLSCEYERSRDNPSWLAKWRPWLVFTDVALAKMRIGETAHAYLKAQELVDERRERYSPMPLI